MNTYTIYTRDLATGKPKRVTGSLDDLRDYLTMAEYAIKRDSGRYRSSAVRTVAEFQHALERLDKGAA